MSYRMNLAFGLFFLFIAAESQEKPQVNLPVPSQENLEYQALKSTFFLISQEYIIYSKDGAPKFRYGKNYFGRTFAVGFLSQNGRLWFPKFVRYPWLSDPNFREYRNNYTPRISGLRYRVIDDTEYRKVINIEGPPKDTARVEMFILTTDTTGISFAEELVQQGTLFIFYTSSPAPENKGDINHVIISVDDLKWDSDGVSYIEDQHPGNNKILGGALYQRLINPGKIEWRLAGFYTQVDGRWALKSVEMFK